MKISDKSVNNYLLYEIDLSIDTVDVDGVTVFADAQALYDELEPIFFLINSSGGGGAVNSVFGRSGTVTAQTGDYAYNELDGLQTNSLVGRHSSGTGETERITIGSGLTLTAGGNLQASGGGAGPTSYSFQFGQGGSLAAGDIVSSSVEGTATNQLGSAVAFNMEVVDISITYGLTTAGAITNVPILIRKISAGTAGTGFPLASGVGTLVKQIDNSIPAGTAYNRVFLDESNTGLTLSAGDVLFIAIGTITGGGSITDISINIRCQKAA